MSRTHRFTRSLAIASVALILVVGASFAHDAVFNAPYAALSPSTVNAVVDSGLDDPQPPDAAVDDQQGDEDDLAGKAEDDALTGDQDEAGDQGENDDQVAPEAPKPAKAHKAKPATHIVSSDAGNQAEDNDNDDADENNDEAKDGEHDDSHDGEHQDGGDEHDDGGDDGSDD